MLLSVGVVVWIGVVIVAALAPAAMVGLIRRLPDLIVVVSCGALLFIVLLTLAGGLLLYRAMFWTPQPPNDDSP